MTPARSVAALYDIHGNLPALEAVLAEPDVRAADLVVVGGDAALGPMPRETLERLRGLGERALFVRGNADRELAAAGGVEASDEPWSLWRDWCADRLGSQTVGFVAGLPLTVSVEVDGLGPVLFCHATPRSDEEIVTRTSPVDRVRGVLAGVDEAAVVCGHTHVQFDRVVDGVRLVNAGSVGMPYEGRTGAYWALLGPDVELRRTEYDVEAAAERIRASGFPRADEWVRDYVLSSYGPEEATEEFERQAREAAGR